MRVRPITPAYLERVALWYLERYPATAQRLRAVLQKRVRNSVRELGEDPEQGARHIETVMDKLIRMRLVDDLQFARSRLRVLRRRGKSARAIGAELRRQGVSAETAEHVFEEEMERAREDEGEGSARILDLEAARLLCRKKKLGFMRPFESRQQERQRDLGRLARAGFSYDIASSVLDWVDEG